MKIKVQTNVGQLTIIEGVRRQDESPYVLAVEPEPFLRLGRDMGRLYIVAESTGDAFTRDDTCQQIIEDVQTAYYQSKGSISAALTDSIRLANTYLYEDNMDSPRDMRRVASVSAVVLRGEQVYIGQAGLNFVYAYHPQTGTLQRFPSEDFLQDNEKLEDEYIVHLGNRKEAQVNLFRTKVSAGDLFLVATSDIVNLAPSEEIAAALDSSRQETVLANLARLTSDNNLAAIVVRIEGMETAAAAESGSRSTPIPPIPQSLKGKVKEFDWCGVGQKLRGMFGGLTNRAKGILSQTLPDRQPTATEKPFPKTPPPPTPHPPTASGSSAEIVTPPRPAVPTIAPRPVQKRTGVNWLILGIIVSAIVILFGLLTFYLYDYRTKKSTEEHYLSLLTGAQRKVELALSSAESVTTTLSLLNEAERLLSEARQMDLGASDSTSISQLQQKIEGRRAEISKVVKLYWLPELAKYEEVESDPARVLVHEKDIYVLDRGTDRVYKYTLNQVGDNVMDRHGEIIVHKGERWEGGSVGDLVDFLWVQPGGERTSESLLILDNGKYLLEYNPDTGVLVLPMGETENWKRPIAAGSYVGNLYILDPPRSQILKYVPLANGYSQPPEDYLNADAGLDLTSAVDMTIDGHIYVMLVDGSILKFLKGAPIAFSQSGLDVPMRNPSAVFASANSQYLYVTDPGNGRIVQFSKDGEFIQQFAPREPGAFDQIKGLYVDEAAERFYIVSGKRLYMANIPTFE